MKICPSLSTETTSNTRSLRQSSAQNDVALLDADRVVSLALVGSVGVEEAVAVHASSLRRRHPPIP